VVLLQKNKNNPKPDGFGILKMYGKLYDKKMSEEIMNYGMYVRKLVIKV
jgi:hypothetical protein